jgi:phosphatidylserine decarboxylase
MKEHVDAYRPRPKQFFIASEGFPFIAAGLGFLLLFAVAGLSFLVLIFIFLVTFTAFFFRNPGRVTPLNGDLIIAPADGKVIRVESGVTAPHLEKPATKVSIFMSVMNVHVNRFPIKAAVKGVFYHPGKFFVASLDKASEHNERNAVVLADEKNREIEMVQIAGLVARRIVCYVRDGDCLDAGERFGLIRFGSRVDLYITSEVEVAVREGQKVVAGETVIGRFL